MTNIDEDSNDSLENANFSDNDEPGQSGNQIKRKNISEEGPLSKKLKKSKDLSKPVTVEELNQLREIENLYNSNLFRIQIDELLKEVNIKRKRQNGFSDWYVLFENYMKNLPEYEDLDEIPKKFTMDDLSIKSDQPNSLKCIKPESINIFGMYKINSLVGPDLNVNINIQMKKKCFLEKDYLNNRYFAKKITYIKYLASELSKSDLVEDIDCSFYQSNTLLPVLSVKPKDVKKVKVTIFVTAPENYFRLSRFLPDKNNVKTKVFEYAGKKFICASEIGTVLYNAAMLHDLTLNANWSFIESTISELKSVQDGIKLLLIWLKQRELNVGFGAFFDDLIPFFMAYLITKKKINKHMSSYQIIRNFWLFLGKTDLQKEPIKLCEDVKLEHFQQDYEMVFVDRSGCFNLMSFVNVDLYEKVKAEARMAITYLDDNKFNSFTALFMTKVPFILQYDLVIKLNCKDFKHIFNSITNDTVTKYIGFYEYVIVQKITQILKEGLTNRIVNIVPHLSEITLKNNASADSILIGISLNPEKAFSVIERGPLPTDPKSKQFRDYWEELAHFRRFPDGTACDAVHFDVKSIKERRAIIKKIISFVCERKLQLNYSLQYNHLEKVLHLNGRPETNEEGCLKAISVSDDLSKKLRNLKLPLEVTAVQGLSDVYSYTEVFPPFQSNGKPNKNSSDVKGDNIIIDDAKMKPKKLPAHLKPIECVIQLSHHSKWPNDLEAIRHIKLGFYLRIAELLREEHKIKTNVKFDYINVYHEGLVFRYHLYVPKEISFLKKEVNSNGLVAFKDTEESVEAEKKLNILPKVVGSLKGIQMEHPSYGPSTCLIKRWLRSQLIDDFHMPDIVIDLLNASLYLNSAPFIAPNLPQVAFLRFLKFMFETNWEIEPLVINFNNEITKEVLDEVESNFRKNRQSYPNLFVIMPYDDCKSLFTKTLTKEIINRIAVLSREMYSVVMDNFVGSVTTNVIDLFTPNLDGYNVLLHLKKTFNSRYHQNVTSQTNFHNHEKFSATTCDYIPIIDFNPVEKYLQELRDFYSEFALFFHDTYGGNVIVVLWKPSIFEAEEFKVSRVDGRILMDDKMNFNVDAVIEDFKILGNGIIQNIERR